MIPSFIAIVPAYTVDEISMQYITFHPIYNTESIALLIVLTNDPYGRGGLTLKAIRKAPHQHHAHDASPANPVISVCVIHSHVTRYMVSVM